MTLAACSSAGRDDVVNIGFTGPLSGGAALYGRNVLDGLQLAIADINAAGGIAVRGRRMRVEVVSLDDRYFPNESATNAKRLVHQHGTRIIFCPHSGGILAIQGFNAGPSPFIIGAYSSEPQILERGNRLTLMIPPRYTVYFDPFAKTMMGRHGRRLGRIPASHAYAKAWTKEFSRIWEEQGGVVLANHEIDYNTTSDFSSVVATALAEKPDVLFVGGPSQATALVVKAAREQGFAGGFALMDQAKFEEMSRIVPMAMLENSVGVMPLVASPDERARRFVERYRQALGDRRDPTREVSLTYLGMRVLARAMELAGTVSDPAAIMARVDEAASTLPEEAKSSDITGVDERGQLRQPLVAAHVLGGKFVPLPLGGDH
jgi:branched-chain amino acid transport system substrate-binding protein